MSIEQPIPNPPDPKAYGWIENEGFDSEPSGWAFEEGEEVYLEAVKEYELLIARNKQ